MSAGASSRPGADDRLRRLLAIVPWVVAQDGPTIDEVSDRFGIGRDELLADLDLLFLCGVHPFTPDTLMDVLVENDRVWIRYADVFARPLRLTPEEGLFLVASGATLLAATGADPQGPLARGLEKLARVLGVEPGETIEIDLGHASPEVLATLRQAVVDARQVEIDYYSYGRDERTRRVVEPSAVFTAEGEWYLSAWCTRAQAGRRFRVDRIRAITVLDRRFEAPGTGGQPLPGTAVTFERPVVFEARADDPRLVLELAPSARWVVEQYPTERVEEIGGGFLRVTLAAGERAWLERLLLRLGPSARVVEGNSTLAREAAERVLRRYGRRDGAGCGGR